MGSGSAANDFKHAFSGHTDLTTWYNLSVCYCIIQTYGTRKLVSYNCPVVYIVSYICFKNKLICWHEDIDLHRKASFYLCPFCAGKRSELLSGNTVVLKEKIDDTNQIFENGEVLFRFSYRFLYMTNWPSVLMRKLQIILGDFLMQAVYQISILCWYW